MPTIQGEMHGQTVQPEAPFRIEHETLKTLIEYALMLGLVVVLAIVAFIVLGPTPSAVTTLGQSNG